jgi:HEAT repeat protein
MDAALRRHFDNIHLTVRETQGAAFQHLLAAATLPGANWAYAVWDELVEALRDPDNRKRSTAAQLLCRLALSDPDKRIVRDFGKLLAVTKDKQFVTARHTLQSLWRIGTAGVRQRKIVLDGLSRRFEECAGEKNGTLIRYDIVVSLRRLYEAVAHGEKIRQQALALIETEDDAKYRKNYAAVWRDVHAA